MQRLKEVPHRTQTFTSQSKLEYLILKNFQKLVFQHSRAKLKCMHYGILQVSFTKKKKKKKNYAALLSWVRAKQTSPGCRWLPS
jgi:TnpA family transposase